MARRLVELIGLIAVTLIVSACVPIGDAAPVVKVGLIAPFEGLGRPLGYALLPEIRNALDAANTDGTLGAYRVALVALNDESDGSEAGVQACVLALDPEVVAVLGPWTAATLETAAPILAGEGIAMIGGAPVAERTGATNVCPPANTLAEALLARATATGTDIIIAGPENALAAALSAAAPQATRRPSGEAVAGTLPEIAVIIHTGEAEAAADDLRKWRAEGWRGPLIGGPDMAQSWFGDLAGSAAEGVTALACGTSAEQGEGDTDPNAHQQQAAQQAITAALGAMAHAVHDTGHPTRAAVAAALAGDPPETDMQWLRYAPDGWRAEAVAPNP